MTIDPPSLSKKELCIGAIQTILLADDCLRTPSCVHDACGDDVDLMARKLLQNNQCQRIYEQFKKHSFDGLKSLVQPHTCKSNLQAGNLLKQEKRRFHKSSTFPRSIKHTPLRTSSQRQKINSLDKNSLSSVPESILDLTTDAGCLSDRSSVFSDDNSDASRLSHAGLQEHVWDSSREDYLYTSTSVCAQHPVLALQSDQSQTSELLEKPMLLHRSNRDVSGKLVHLLRHIFPHISSKNQKEYLAIQNSGDKILKLKNHLCRMLKMVEGDQHPYYSTKSFESLRDYTVWKEKEIKELVKLIGDDALPPGDVEPIERSRHGDYVTLFKKVVEHGNYKRTRRVSNSSRLSESSQPESDAHSHCSFTSHLVSERTRRLLKEFSLRYRLTPVTQCTCALQSIVSSIEEGMRSLEEDSVLNEATYQMEVLIKLLDRDNHVILTSELQAVCTVAESFVKNLKPLLVSLVAKWQTSADTLTSALKLLRASSNLLTMHHTTGTEEYQKIVKEIFISGIREDYFSTTRLSCQCKDPCDGLPLATLLRSVVHVIATVNNQVEGYHNAFKNCVDDVTEVSAKVLYACVIDDVERLERDKAFASAKGKDFSAAIVLVTKLSELDESVSRAGFTPNKTRWRSLLHPYTSGWITQLKKEMEQMVLLCVHHDDVIKVPVHSKVGIPLERDASSTSVKDKVVSTRVPACNARRHDKQDDTMEQKHISHMTQNSDVRIRLQTISSEASIKFSPQQMAESSFGDHIGGVSDDQKQNQNNGEDNSFDNSYPVVQCTQSVVDFVVLLNRFVEIVDGIYQALYKLSMDFYDNLEPKESFCSNAFKCASLLIAQYCDCLLNLDVCIFPEIDLKRFLKKEKLKELIRRGRVGTIDCCRHQLAGQLDCRDRFHPTKLFEENGIYFKMAQHINSVALLDDGIELIWQRLSHCLEINDATTPPVKSSYHLTSSLYSTSTCSIAETITERSESFHSDNTVVNNAVPTVQKETVKSQDCFSLSDEEETISANQEEVVTSFNSIAFACDKNNNGSQENNGTNFDMKRMSSSPAKGCSRHCVETAFCTNIPPNPVKQFYSDFEEPTEHSHPKTSRPTSAEELLRMHSSITEYDIPQRVDTTNASVRECVHSLSSIYGWRVAQHLENNLVRAFQTQHVIVKLESLIDKSDIETCVSHCQPFLTQLQQALDALSHWLQPNCLLLAGKAIWNVVCNNITKEARTFDVLKESTRTRAFVMLILHKEILKIFVRRRIEESFSESENLYSLCTSLELITMPTSHVLRLYDNIEEKLPATPNDQPRPLGDDLPGHVVRKLCRQQRSFSGDHLVGNVLLHMRYDKSSNGDREKAKQLCERLFKRGLIELLNPKDASKCRMPSLVPECSNLTASFDSQDFVAVPIVKSGLSFTATPSDQSSESELSSDYSEERQFVDDKSHFYGFVLASRNIPLLHFSNSNGEDLDVEFLNQILLARSHRDMVARESLLQRGIKKRSLFSSCFP